VLAIVAVILLVTYVGSHGCELTAFNCPGRH
jgi:hypothetical protein